MKELKKMKKRCGVLALTMIAVLFLNGNGLSAQSFSRTLEVRRDRMNGADVRAIQERLLSFGFSSVGEADGYYGPATEGVIKAIQPFLGFEETGKVDRLMWNCLFNDNNQELLRLVSEALEITAAPYYKAELKHTWGIDYDCTLYFSRDRKLKVLSMKGYWGGDGIYGTKIFHCVFINPLVFFIQEKNETSIGTTTVGPTTKTQNYAYYHDGSCFYELRQGEKRNTDFSASFIGELLDGILIVR